MSQWSYLDNIKLPQRLAKAHTNLRLCQPDSTLYSVLLRYSQQLWPDLHLIDDHSLGDGTPFLASSVAQALPYIQKDGLRYGSKNNRRTQADKYAFVRTHPDSSQNPVEILWLFALQISNEENSNARHVCAVVQQMLEDENIPQFPWDLQCVLESNASITHNRFRSASTLGIRVSHANKFGETKVIPATAIEAPLALIPISLNNSQENFWASISFDHVCRVYILHVVNYRTYSTRLERSLMK